MMYLLIIGLVFAVWYFSLLQRYGKLWDEIEPFSSTQEKAASIVVPFRNEEGRLHWILGALTHLETKGYSVEVIFVDDHSTDKSYDIVAEVKLPMEVKVVKNRGEGKKEALKTAWAEARYDIILQTDADCYFEQGWLATMLSQFGAETHLVSGPVRFFDGFSFWSRMVQLDFAALIAIGGAHIQWRRPLLCNGANMAYRKSLVNGADLNEEKASGDDVFLLQSAFQQSEGGVRFCKNYDACVGTPGPATFGEFYHQRLRWSSKNSDYADKKNTWLLLGLWAYNMLIVICLCMATLGSLTLAALLVIVKVVAEDGFYARFVDFFKFEGWFTKIFLGQPFHILYMAVMPVLSQVVRYKWKERKLK